MTRTKRAAICCMALLFVTKTAMIVFAADIRHEQPGDYKASELLKKEILQGKYHKVDEVVQHDGFFYHFSVQSDFGEFTVVSNTSLVVLIHELSAIAAMKEVETSETAMKSFKESGKKAMTGLKNLFADPQGTMEGAGQ